MGKEKFLNELNDMIFDSDEITFKINEGELKNLREWVKEHNKTCKFANPENLPVVGQRFAFVFTPTSVAMSMKIHCMCGEFKDINDYDVW